MKYGRKVNKSCMWRSVKLKTLLKRQDKRIIFYLGPYTTWYIDCFPNNLKLQSSMLSYEICGGVLTASQGLMSLFTAILLGSGQYLWGVIACCRSCLQSVFFCSLASSCGKYGGYVSFHWLAVWRCMGGCHSPVVKVTHWTRLQYGAPTASPAPPPTF